MHYKHTQIGNLVIAILVIMIIHFTYIANLTSYELSLIIILAIVAFILISFSSLTVQVTTTKIKIKFGWGIFRKTFLLKDIASVKQVKNKWYYGWGIRYWSRPKMWIFNVSGFDAIELRMKNKKIYRIGTNEPQSLEYAIKQGLR